jgi:hypothetical protein
MTHAWSQRHKKINCVQTLTWLFQFVGDDASDEVRLGAPQCGHQIVQLLL